MARQERTPSSAVRDKRADDGRKDVLDLDEALFRAWKSGDEDARNKAWELLWCLLYTMAFRFCRSLCCRDDAMAENCASEAFLRTWTELEREMKEGAIAWKDAPSFLAYVTRKLIWRCRDECRRLRDREGVEVPLADDGEDGALSPAPTVEDPLVAREQVQLLMNRLAEAREMCCDEPALQAVLGRIHQYVRERLAEAIPDSVNPDEMSDDELLAQADLRTVDLSKADAYEYVMSKLTLSRNAFDQRMKRIRRIVPNLCSTTCIALEEHDRRTGRNSFKS